MPEEKNNKERKLTQQEAAIIEYMKRLNMEGGQGGAGTQLIQAQEDKKHQFWDTQPMPHDGTDHPEGPIEPNKPKEDIRATPYAMPAGFEWSNVDISSNEQREEVYELLANNYVEDDDCQFRFDYSRDFLEWALLPPGFREEWLLGVRSSKKKRLVAFISAIPATIQVRGPQVEMVEINFLCVHKKLRSKRLAPVLIKEITRRVNLCGIFQAVYTAGVTLPVPVGTARYYHRSLNPKKLVQVGFTRLPDRTTMARFCKRYQLTDELQTKGLREMTQDDVDGVYNLLTEYLNKFPLHIQFSKDEIAHWLLPRKGVINSYVVQQDGQVTDFVSFYHLPSSILGRHDTLYAAYSFYNVATSTDLEDLMRDALVLAKRKGADVFNALTLMENERFLDDLKFGKGDGDLQYYIYNWACPTMKAKEIGLVLL